MLDYLPVCDRKTCGSSPYPLFKDGKEVILRKYNITPKVEWERHRPFFDLFLT